jgi:hypothetical protein
MQSETKQSITFITKGPNSVNSDDKNGSDIGLKDSFDFNTVGHS